MKKRSLKEEICAVCGDKLRATPITHEEKRAGQFYLFENVPAQVCSACGEIWIEEAILQRIDELIEKGQPTSKIESPVYDLALAGSK